MQKHNSSLRLFLMSAVALSTVACNPFGPPKLSEAEACNMATAYVQKTFNTGGQFPTKVLEVPQCKNFSSISEQGAASINIVAPVFKTVV